MTVMARGVRKTTLEKLQIELRAVRDSIQQYETSLQTLKEREANIAEQIELEEFKEFKTLMEDSGLTLDDIKELISHDDTKQSA